MTSSSAGWRSSRLLATSATPGRSPSSRSNARTCAATDRRSSSTSTARLGASGGSPRPGAPRCSSSRHCDSSRPSATTIARSRGVVAARWASARPVETVLPEPTCEASTPEPTTFSAAICCWRPSSTGSSASGRASVIRTAWRAPASSVTFAPPFLSARSRLIACSATRRRVDADSPSLVVMVSMPGRPFIRPIRTVSLSCPAASVDSSSGSPASTAVWIASPSSMTALRCAWRSSRRAAPSRRWVKPRAGNVMTRRPSSTCSGPRGVLVRAALDEQASPAVALVAQRAGRDGLPELARELAGELAGAVEQLLAVRRAACAR